MVVAAGGHILVLDQVLVQLAVTVEGHRLDPSLVPRRQVGQKAEAAEVREERREWIVRVNLRRLPPSRDPLPRHLKSLRLHPLFPKRIASLSQQTRGNLLVGSMHQATAPRAQSADMHMSN